MASQQSRSWGALLLVVSLLGALVNGQGCTVIKVQSGNSCQSLATTCKISLAQFMSYNPAIPTACNNLQVDQRVCCSAGGLPDITPKPYANGTCATYTVQKGEWCDKIAAANSITSALIESYNKATWGWNGCTAIQPDIRICLSSGTPPLPAPIPGATCGPQMPGSAPPANGTDLASLNPCPINACCNMWGNCGVTPEFCTPKSTSNPAGCISNCGTGIVNNTTPAPVFRRVGYFQAYNGDRPCLHMNVTSFNASRYDHLHFAFIDVTERLTFSVANEVVLAQFNDFVSLKTTAKRIISIGGWAASTAPDRYQILRNAMGNAANITTFVNNLASLVAQFNFDGVDLDWEYLGSATMPTGVPAPTAADATRYATLVRQVRKALPANRTVSMTIPAAYSNLRSYPLSSVVSSLDYVVAMEYDLHGLWDYGSSYLQPGCPTGDCTRSHVNLTETLDSLGIITRAGVPASKIVVGLASYGNTYRLASPGCDTDGCRILDPSTADGAPLPGRCTGQPGHLAQAEIDEIAANATRVTRRYSDAGSNSQVLVYDGDQWVSWMTDSVKDARTRRYMNLNFGGTADWAVDLQRFY